MSRCVIFCAAEFTGLLEPLRPDDFILAADGGYAHVQSLGLTPNGVLGDFDSLGYIPPQSLIFPVEKDDTDTMLAIKKGLELGYKQFLLYGSLDGPRLDHTVANFQALRYLCDHGGQGFLIGNRYIVTAVKNGWLSFLPQACGIISVFALGEKAEGVTLSGLQYPLTDGTLECGFPLGVSNHFIGQESRISVKNGCILVIFDRENGMPAGSYTTL